MKAAADLALLPRVMRGQGILTAASFLPLASWSHRQPEFLLRHLRTLFSCPLVVASMFWAGTATAILPSRDTVTQASTLGWCLC